MPHGRSHCARDRIDRVTPKAVRVAANGDGTVTVTGTNWNPDSLIYFDGLPAVVTSLDADNGIAIVTPPTIIAIATKSESVPPCRL